MAAAEVGRRFLVGGACRCEGAEVVPSLAFRAWRAAVKFAKAVTGWIEVRRSDDAACMNNNSSSPPSPPF